VNTICIKEVNISSRTRRVGIAEKKSQVAETATYMRNAHLLESTTYYHQKHQIEITNNSLKKT